MTPCRGVGRSNAPARFPVWPESSRAVENFGVDCVTLAISLRIILNQSPALIPNHRMTMSECSAQTNTRCPVIRSRVTATPHVARFAPTRWALAAVGLLSVGLGALGVIVPGLPTTIFLIIASWCFLRSCPWLERKLIRNKFFRPFLQHLQPGARMPLRAQIIALAMMWTAITISVTMLTVRSDTPLWVLVVIPSSGVLGSWCIYRAGLQKPLTASVENTSAAPLATTA